MAYLVTRGPMDKYPSRTLPPLSLPFCSLTPITLLPFPSLHSPARPSIAPLTFLLSLLFPILSFPFPPSPLLITAKGSGESSPSGSGRSLPAKSQTYFSAIHSPKSANVSKFSPTCTRGPYNTNSCKLWLLVNYLQVTILCLHYFGDLHPHPCQGRNHSWKVEGDQGLGPNNGALVPRTRPKAGMGAGGGRPLLLWGSGGNTPRKMFENSDAKYCILVTTVLISGLPRTCISKQTQAC